MLESARRAISYIDGVSAADFDRDLKTQDAVIYRIGIVGEAARHVSAETCGELALDWMAIRSMRHRLFHGYRELRLDIVWTTVGNDLPQLVRDLEQFLGLA